MDESIGKWYWVLAGVMLAYVIYAFVSSIAQDETERVILKAAALKRKRETEAEEGAK